MAAQVVRGHGHIGAKPRNKVPCTFVLPAEGIIHYIDTRLLPHAPVSMPRPLTLCPQELASKLEAVQARTSSVLLCYDGLSNCAGAPAGSDAN